MSQHFFTHELSLCWGKGSLLTATIFRKTDLPTGEASIYQAVQYCWEIPNSKVSCLKIALRAVSTTWLRVKTVSLTPYIYSPFFPFSLKYSVMLPSLCIHFSIQVFLLLPKRSPPSPMSNFSVRTRVAPCSCCPASTPGERPANCSFPLPPAPFFYKHVRECLEINIYFELHLYNYKTETHECTVVYARRLILF